MALGIHLFPYRTQKLSLATPMVLGGWPPGRVGSCWIKISPSGSWRTLHGMVELSERLSLLTKSFLVQKIYTCHENSPSKKAYPSSRAIFRGKWWVSELLDPNQGIFAYTEHGKQVHPTHGGSSTEWFTECESLITLMILGTGRPPPIGLIR